MPTFPSMAFFRMASLTLAWTYCAHAGEDITAQGRLDFSRVQQAYLEADWNPLAKRLDQFLRKPGSKAERIDSIWAFKYLGAIRASRPETRLQGEECFRRLLILDPAFEASGLGDLFVSEEVVSVFRRMKTESRNAPAAPMAPAPGSLGKVPGKVPEKAPEMSWGKAVLWASASAGAAAAVALGAIYYFRAREGEREEVIRIPFPAAESGP